MNWDFFPIHSIFKTFEAVGKITKAGKIINKDQRIINLILAQAALLLVLKILDFMGLTEFH